MGDFRLEVAEKLEFTNKKKPIDIEAIIYESKSSHPQAIELEYNANSLGLTYSTVLAGIREPISVVSCLISMSSGFSSEIFSSKGVAICS